ncbi:hypothetical protein NC651_015710 [Populus alba x Populus x berolinensis]|nr:hypothetical protein NC651_015710 [Populus alba x Populus x berolinensis]
MGILGMGFFILSSFERKGMGFHEAFFPKKGMKFYPFSRRVLGFSTTLLKCSFADRTSQCFQVLCSFWRSRINCFGTDFYSFESALRVQRSESLPPLLCVLCDC